MSVIVELKNAVQEYERKHGCLPPELRVNPEMKRRYCLWIQQNVRRGQWVYEAPKGVPQHTLQFNGIPVFTDSRIAPGLIGYGADNE